MEKETEKEEKKTKNTDESTSNKKVTKATIKKEAKKKSKKEEKDETEKEAKKEDKSETEKENKKEDKSEAEKENKKEDKSETEKENKKEDKKENKKSGEKEDKLKDNDETKKSTKTSSKEVSKTEMIEVKDNKSKGTKKSKKGNIVLGIIGGLLGGIIATIPWILIYIYGDIISSALSILIAIGVLYGYKLFNGRVTKGLPAIIMTTSLVVVAITTLVIIPALLLYKTGKTFNFEEFKLLYTNQEFVEALAKDSVISIVFTIFGAGVIVSNVHRQIKEGKSVDILLNDENKQEKAKAIKEIKPIFEKFNAFSKDHGIIKDELMQELDDDNKVCLKLLKSYGIVKKSSGRFYYRAEVEEKQSKPKGKVREKVLTIIIGLLLIITMVAVIFIDKTGILKKIEVNDGTVSFVLRGGWEEYTSYYESSYNYYRYINSEELPEDEMGEEGDYSHYPAMITITTYDMNPENLTTIDEIKESMQNYVDESEEKPTIFEDNTTKSERGYDVYSIKMQYDGSVPRIEYVYYILNTDKVAVIDAYSFTVEDGSEIEKNIKETIKSFSWVNQ